MMTAVSCLLVAGPSWADVGFGVGQNLSLNVFMAEARAAKAPNAPRMVLAGDVIGNNPTTCTSDKTFCEGMPAYLAKNIPGVIGKIYSDKEFYFIPDFEYHDNFTLPNKRRRGLKVHSFQVIPAEGCLGQYCVGDHVYVQWNGWIFSTIKGVSKEYGTVIVSEMHSYNAGYRNVTHKPEEVYLAKGCTTDNFCVGALFVDKEGAQGKIVAVALDGEVVVELSKNFGETDIVLRSYYKWPTNKIPK